jgi:hypothetical protein
MLPRGPRTNSKKEDLFLGLDAGQLANHGEFDLSYRPNIRPFNMRSTA